MHHGTAIPSSSRSPIESSEAVPGPSRIVVEPADGLQSQVEHNQIAGTNEAQNNSYIPQSELESQELEKSRSRESGGVLVADEIEEDRDLQGEGEESRQEENDMDMDADYDMTAWATSNANWESSQERLPRAPTPPNRDPMATEHQTRMPTMEELMDEDPSTSSSSYAASTSGLNNQGNNDNADNLDTDGAQGAMDSNTSDTPDQTNTPPNHFIEELNAQLLRNLRQSILAGHVPPQFMQGFTFPPLIGVGVVGGRVITGIPPGVLAGGIIGAADGHYMTAEEYLQEDPEPVLEQPDPIMDIEADNPDFARFCERLYYYSHFDDTRFKINYAALEIRRLKRQEAVTREDMDEKKLDYQAIPWDTLGLTRDEFRTLRNKSYRNYRNLGGPNPPTEVLPETRRFFRFRRQDNSHKVRFAHFQLRNTLGVTSRNDVYYASGDARVRRAGANMQGSEVIMDLTNTNSLSRSAAPMKITTMATRHGICIAGGFAGEYALKRLDAPLSSLPTIGHVTLSESGITNHVHAHLSRTSATPLAVFSSNDSKIRVLDCYTNTFLCEQPFDWPINCSATSPDSRLRVLVGDNKGVLIVDADRGETLKVLEGHQDYGFSCAWSDDGYTIATGNQDQTVRIYDARNFGKVVAELGTQIAGARSLRFSEVGMGRRVLVVPEPADYVTVVDATTWKDCQRFDFFGEVGGCEFSPVGGELFVANTDVAVGGLMEFERMKGMDEYECGAEEEDEDWVYLSEGGDEYGDKCSYGETGGSSGSGGGGGGSGLNLSFLKDETGDADGEDEAMNLFQEENEESEDDEMQPIYRGGGNTPPHRLQEEARRRRQQLQKIQSARRLGKRKSSNSNNNASTGGGGGPAIPTGSVFRSPPTPPRSYRNPSPPAASSSSALAAGAAAAAASVSIPLPPSPPYHNSGVVQTWGTAPENGGTSSLSSFSRSPSSSSPSPSSSAMPQRPFSTTTPLRRSGRMLATMAGAAAGDSMMFRPRRMGRYGLAAYLGGEEEEEEEESEEDGDGKRENSPLQVQAPLVESEDEDEEGAAGGEEEQEQEQEEEMSDFDAATTVLGYGNERTRREMCCESPSASSSSSSGSNSNNARLRRPARPRRPVGRRTVAREGVDMWRVFV